MEKKKPLEVRRIEVTIKINKNGKQECEMDGKLGGGKYLKRI